MRILGISAFYHDSAAALVVDGQIVAAAQEERFTRKKHDAGFPAQRDRLLPGGGRRRRSTSVDHVAFYDKPFLKFERLLETYLAFAPRGLQLVPHGDAALAEGEAVPEGPAARASCGARRRDFDWSSELLFTEHHLSHAASAFFPSPFEEAAVLTMDGVGEWATTSVGVGRGTRPRDARRRSTSRTRSACSTRPSPTTPASRSTPASTR